MRLPHKLIEAPCFVFFAADELIGALGPACDTNEALQIRALYAKGLPPVTSKHVLATMLGVNPGFVWSLANRPRRYYRTFQIPKGRGTRTITAPRIALKIIQKWLGHHLARAVPTLPHVYGFVPGRSHIEAAYVHHGAEWALSVDIANFFQTTTTTLVTNTFRRLGYTSEATSLLTSLTCFEGALAQGAPSSPALSNLCFTDTDTALVELSKKYACKISRYADDIVLSGKGKMPAAMREDVQHIFENTPWQLAPEKEFVQPLKGRIKVHGLVVNGAAVRTTKGYRNKLRAYAHILATRGEQVKDRHILLGHSQYEQHVAGTINRLSESQTSPSLDVNEIVGSERVTSQTFQED